MFIEIILKKWYNLGYTSIFARPYVRMKHNFANFFKEVCSL